MILDQLPRQGEIKANTLGRNMFDENIFTPTAIGAPSAPTVPVRNEQLPVTVVSESSP